MGHILHPCLVAVVLLDWYCINTWQYIPTQVNEWSSEQFLTIKNTGNIIGFVLRGLGLQRFNDSACIPV